MNMDRPIEVPQTDPKAGYLAHQAEIDSAIQRVLDSGRYILGPEVESFEQEFASYIGVRHAMGVGNGTDALELALRACGVGPGDMVFTVSHTAVATVAAIELVGATPVLVDIDPVTYTLDPNCLEAALTRPPAGTPKAVIPVHLYGQPADMPAVLELARRHGLYVIEDCAQSHGATLAGRMTGAWGDLAAFSFYPTKNLGALGDGGMVVTDDPALAERVRLLQQYGWRERYISDIPGGNSRLDELQAAILQVKLQHLDAENECRRRLAQTYNTLLADTGFSLPEARPGATHAFHQYAVCLPQRDALRTYLRQAGIGTLVHYPTPVHLQPAYQDRLPLVATLPWTEQVARQVLSLPIYPQLSDDQVRRVSHEIVRFLEDKAAEA
ncbi:MAG: DegT/DnrJ/EryC1/StrS family aminotransferase [Syntrophales bacterium]|nr:DegT/DnrJ/EryC1/StrS family aminotransferase [Syntrophales bacterium]